MTRRMVSITIETERLVVILRGTSARVWCEQCATEVDMVSIESAAALAQVDVKTIRHLVGQERLHRTLADAPVRLCLSSLLNFIQKKSLQRGTNNSFEIPTVED